MLTFTRFLRTTTTACAVSLGLACWPVAAATQTVHFGYPYYQPNDLTIHPGDTVEWVHDPDGFSHTVTGTGSEPLCGVGTVPVSCSHTFADTGTFPYKCIIDGHAAAGMTGVVRVVSMPVTAVAAVLTNAVALANGNFQFTVQSTANVTNLIQATTNVASATNWVLVGTITPTNRVFTFTDTNASQFGLRLYRVVEP